jgi:hypothetical protein
MPQIRPSKSDAHFTVENKEHSTHAHTTLIRDNTYHERSHDQRGLYQNQNIRIVYLIC